jgi:hypothetical protein
VARLRQRLMTFPAEAFDQIGAFREAYAREWPGRLPNDTDAFFLAALERGFAVLDKELAAHAAPSLVLPDGARYVGSRAKGT